MSILCYHSIDADWESNLAMPPIRFAEQCAWLREHRRVVDLQEGVRRLVEWRLPRGFVALTFDDGFSDLHTFALPVLRQYELPATVFLIAERFKSTTREVDWVDDPPPWPLRTLTAEQVLEMHEAGIRFGSHGLVHQDLTLLGETECLSGLKTSRELLEDLLKTHVRWLAYPRGRHDERVRRAAERAGFTHGFAMYGGPEAAGPFAIPRAGIFRRNRLMALRIKTTRSYLKARGNAQIDHLIELARGNRGPRTNLMPSDTDERVPEA